MGFHEFMPSSEILSKLEGQLCQVQPYLCVNLLSAICGYNPDNLNIERLPIYLNYTPSGTSVKNMAKWAQVCILWLTIGVCYYIYFGGSLDSVSVLAIAVKCTASRPRTMTRDQWQGWLAQSAMLLCGLSPSLLTSLDHRSSSSCMHMQCMACVERDNSN